LEWPEEYGMGGFKTNPTDAKPFCPTRGIKWKKDEPIVFQPGVAFLANPKNFEIFKPGDLYGLDFHNCSPEYMKPALLNQITRMSDLRGLDLEGCPDFGDTHLKIIEKLTKLKYLSLCSTNVSGDALAKSPLLKRIDWLRFSRCANASAVVAALRGNTKLRGLQLSFDNLTSEDYKTIATISNLEALTLYGSLTKQSDFMLLAPLKKLRYIAAPELHVTTDIIPTLKVMKNHSLKDITVSAEGLSEEEKLEIGKAFPHINLYLPKEKQGMDIVDIKDWQNLTKKHEQ